MVRPIRQIWEELIVSKQLASKLLLRISEFYPVVDSSANRAFIWQILLYLFDSHFLVGTSLKVSPTLYDDDQKKAHKFC